MKHKITNNSPVNSSDRRTDESRSRWADEESTRKTSCERDGQLTKEQESRVAAGWDTEVARVSVGVGVSVGIGCYP